MTMNWQDNWLQGRCELWQTEPDIGDSLPDAKMIAYITADNPPAPTYSLAQFLLPGFEMANIPSYVRLDADTIEEAKLEATQKIAKALTEIRQSTAPWIEMTSKKLQELEERMQKLREGRTYEV